MALSSCGTRDIHHRVIPDQEKGSGGGCIEVGQFLDDAGYCWIMVDRKNLLEDRVNLDAQQPTSDL